MRKGMVSPKQVVKYRVTNSGPGHDLWVKYVLISSGHYPNFAGIYHLVADILGAKYEDMLMDAISIAGYPPIEQRWWAS